MSIFKTFLKVLKSVLRDMLAANYLSRSTAGQPLLSLGAKSLGTRGSDSPEAHM